MGVSVIVDDTVSFDFNYVGDQWTHQTGQSSVFNGTLSVCNAGAKGITPPSLTFFFYGSDINFYGTLTSGLAVNYSIDHSTVRPAVFPTDATVGKTGVNLFSLQNLTNAQFHSLELLPTAGQFTLDYVTYTPNTVTPLIAASLIIDDHDTSLQYSANWNSTTGNFKVGPPYNGTMTGTGTKGSTMKFSFVGSAISVYGLLNQVDGRLSASFAVDGANATATKFTPFNGSQTASPSTWLLSQQFFHQDLAPGDHSLLVTLNDVSGSQMLWIDSVVFEGTASTLLTTTTSSSPSKFPNAAIGGIVVAVIVVVFLYACCCRRRRYLSSTVLINTPPPPLPAPAPSLQPQNMFNIVYGDYPQINSPYTPRYTQEEIPRFPSQPPQDYRQRPVATTPVASQWDFSAPSNSLANELKPPPNTLTVSTQEWELAPMVSPSPPRNVNPATQTDGQNPAPSRSRNTASEDLGHAQEDGRDDDVNPRETDAGPGPPAYDENSYTR